MRPPLLPRFGSAGPFAAIAAGIALGVGVALASCDQVQVVIATAASLEVSPGSITIEIDETSQLQATVRDASGTVLGGQSILWASTNPSVASVDVNGDVLGIGVGVVTVTARSGGATGSAQVVVESPPGFALDRTVVSMTAATGAIAGPETVLISGTGANPTTGLTTTTQYLQQAGDWLLVALSSTSTPASMQISASTQGLAPGLYEADVIVRADRVPSQGIRVSLTVSQPPTIGISPTTASFSAPQGGPNPSGQVFTVANLGSDSITGLQATVSYGSGQPGGWLTSVLASTTAPSDLALSVSVGTLTPGTYTAMVNVSSPDAVNSPQALPVTLVVGPSLPRIQLTPSTVSFSTVVGGPDPGPATVGVSNSGGGTLDQLSATVTYSGAQSGWLAATLNTTTAPATLTLGASASGLPVGTHVASVTVASPAAANSPRVVTVQFTIGNSPSIVLSPTSLSFSGVSGGSSPASKSVSVSNGGGGSLGGLSVASISYGSGSGWLSASLGSATAPTSATVTSNPGGLAAGTYTATVSIASTTSGVTNSPQSFGVTFVVSPPPPTIGLSTNSVSFTAAQGGANPSGQAVAVSNTGSGTLDQLSTSISYQGGQSGWLSAPIAPSTAPATVSLSATTGSLPQGTHTATVSVASANGAVTNSPQQITVSFTITNPPSIAFSPAGSVSLNGFAGGPAVVNSSKSVVNGGGGTLNGLSVASITYGSGSGWLGATLGSTTAPTSVTLTANPGGLSAGSYSATVSIASTAPGVTNSPQSFNVNFTVAPPPTISLSDNAPSMTGLESPGLPLGETRQVNVTNGTGGGGAGDLTGLAATINYVSGTNWLAATWNTTTSPAILTLTTDAHRTPLAPGTYTANVDVTSPVAGNSPQTIGVTFVVDNAPSILLTPSTISNFTASLSGGSTNPANQVVVISNNGGGTAGSITGITRTLSNDGAGGVCTNVATNTNWLTAVLSQTTSPANMTISASAASLAGTGPGVYCGRIRVFSPTAKNSGGPDIVVVFQVSS